MSSLDRQCIDNEFTAFQEDVVYMFVFALFFTYWHLRAQQLYNQRITKIVEATSDRYNRHLAKSVKNNKCQLHYTCDQQTQTHKRCTKHCSDRDLSSYELNKPAIVHPSPFAFY